MLDRFFRRLALKGQGAALRALPDGVRLYAVGDVHGQDDLLARMLDKLRQDALDAPLGTDITLVMLGDYIDRGLGSRAALERLSTLSDMPFHTRFLIGNHEATMRDFLADASVGPAWVEHGGGETLASYGVKPPAGSASAQDWEAARLALNQALPDHTRAFLERLEPYVLIEPYLFVHAGIDPAKPLEAQSEQELLWIRDRFLDARRSWDYVVVHGHTPEPDYYRDARRIGLDTGAYLTGVLTAVRLEGEGAHFLQVRRNEA